MWEIPVQARCPLGYTDMPSRKVITPAGGLGAEEEAGLDGGLEAGLGSLDPGLEGSAGQARAQVVPSVLGDCSMRPLGQPAQSTDMQVYDCPRHPEFMAVLQAQAGFPQS